jgi:hypothetical protein
MNLRTTLSLQPRQSSNQSLEPTAGGCEVHI